MSDERRAFLLVTLFLGALVFPAVNRGKYEKIYDMAARYAVNEFGDQQTPLLESEQRERYRQMGTREGEEPGKFTLYDYIDDCEKRKVESFEGKLEYKIIK